MRKLRDIREQLTRVYGNATTPEERTEAAYWFAFDQKDYTTLTALEQEGFKPSCEGLEPDSIIAQLVDALED